MIYNNSMARIPSFNVLRSFEAAVRHRSMTRAAEELCVTHGAISKQIQALEEELGVTLLRRLHRSVEPTPEADQLAKTLGTAFGLIETGVKQVQPGPLSVSCSASILMRWLIPRLSNFKKAQPEIDLQISTDHGPTDMLRDGISIAIRNDVIPSPSNVVVKPLMREWIGPVCSPEYAKENKINELADLVRARLLATSSRQNAWAEWLALSGCKDACPKEHESYEHFYVALHAAACGLGMTIAPSFLVDDDLTEGRLVAPFGFLPGQRNVVLWISPQVRTRTDIRAFSDWLCQEVDCSYNRT